MTITLNVWALVLWISIASVAAFALGVAFADTHPDHYLHDVHSPSVAP